MRAIFQRSPGVSYLFAGSIEHLMRDLFTPSHLALHQFGGFYDLRPIDHDAWMEGLAKRYSADACTVEPSALRRIVEYGELHPRTTMLIAQKSHLATVELDTRTVDGTIIEQGLLMALAADRISHEQAVERIRSMHKLGPVVAERLARNETVYTRLLRGTVRRALEGLRNAAIIESRGRGDWRFTSPHSVATCWASSSSSSHSRISAHDAPRTLPARRLSERLARPGHFDRLTAANETDRRPVSRR